MEITNYVDKLNYINNMMFLASTLTIVILVVISILIIIKFKNISIPAVFSTYVLVFTVLLVFYSNNFGNKKADLAAKFYNDFEDNTGYLIETKYSNSDKDNYIKEFESFISQNKNVIVAKDIRDDTLYNIIVENKNNRLKLYFEKDKDVYIPLN